MHAFGKDGGTERLQDGVVRQTADGFAKAIVAPEILSFAEGPGIKPGTKK